MRRTIPFVMLAAVVMLVGAGIASQVGPSYVCPSGTVLKEIHGFAVVRLGSRVCAPKNQPMPTLPPCSVTDCPGISWGSEPHEVEHPGVKTSIVATSVGLGLILLVVGLVVGWKPSAKSRGEAAAP